MLTLSSAAKPPPPPSRRRRVKLKNLKNPRAGGPSTFPFTALLNNLRRKPHPLFCPLRREISPLRFATVEMTIGVPANIVISSGDACRYGADGKRIDDTLSPEISQRNAVPRTIRGGDFSTPLRYGRNDDRARLFFIKSAPEGRHHHPRPEGLSPPERKRRNPSTQPAAPAAPPSFIICARRAPPQPSACKAVKLKNPWAVGPSILRTFLPAPKRPLV